MTARRPPAGVSGLHALRALHDELRRRQAEAAAAEVARERERARVEQAGRAEREAFVRAVGPVHALPARGARGRAEVHRPRPPPEPRQRLADERAALREALSDEVDIASLLLTDDGLSFRRRGIAEDVVTRLRRGQWAIQNQIDLHGMTRDEAREALAAFVRRMHRHGHRCVRVVHGKGHGSPGRQPVLKGKVQRWLAQCREVIAFSQASAPQGGAGALIVLLDGRA